MTCVSRKGMTAPGLKVTMLQCMSCRRSAESTKRVVDQTPLVSGMGVGSVVASDARMNSGAAMFGAGS